MVHALEEAHRVLRRGGSMIDLRPTDRNRQVELELPAARLCLGEIDSASSIADHFAANAALRETCDSGLFRLLHDERLEYVMEMDAVDELREFGAGLRRSVLPEEIIKRAESLVQDESAYRIRIRREMQIASYIRL